MSLSTDNDEMKVSTVSTAPELVRRGWLSMSLPDISTARMQSSPLPNSSVLLGMIEGLNLAWPEPGLAGPGRENNIKHMAVIAAAATRHGEHFHRSPCGKITIRFTKPVWIFFDIFCCTLFFSPSSSNPFIRILHCSLHGNNGDEFQQQPCHCVTE